MEITQSKKEILTTREDVKQAIENLRLQIRNDGKEIVKWIIFFGTTQILITIFLYAIFLN